MNNIMNNRGKITISLNDIHITPESGIWHDRNKTKSENLLSLLELPRRQPFKRILE